MDVFRAMFDFTPPVITFGEPFHLMGNYPLVKLTVMTLTLRRALVSHIWDDEEIYDLLEGRHLDSQSIAICMQSSLCSIVGRAKWHGNNSSDTSNLHNATLRRD